MTLTWLWLLLPAVFLAGMYAGALGIMGIAALSVIDDDEAKDAEYRTRQ